MFKEFVEQMCELFMSILCEPCYIRVEYSEDND